MPAIPKKLPILSPVGPAPTITTETDVLTWSPSLSPCPGDRYSGRESTGSLLISNVSFIKAPRNYSSLLADGNGSSIHGLVVGFAAAGGKAHNQPKTLANCVECRFIEHVP